MKLRVVHFPQIPCKPFTVEVCSLEEALKTFDLLTNYDIFQYENRIKPDYSNATVLEIWNEHESDWQDWYDEATGIDDIHEYFEQLKLGESHDPTTQS